jgi:hypothetical protein
VDEVGVTLSVFTDDKDALAKVLETFKNVAYGMALEGVSVSVSVHRTEDEVENEDADG